MIEWCRDNITACSTSRPALLNPHLWFLLTLVTRGWLTHCCIHITHLIAAKERVCNKNYVEEDVLGKRVGTCYRNFTIWPVSPISKYDLDMNILNDSNTRDL